MTTTEAPPAEMSAEEAQDSPAVDYPNQSTPLSILLSTLDFDPGDPEHIPSANHLRKLILRLLVFSRPMDFDDFRAVLRELAEPALRHIRSHDVPRTQLVEAIDQGLIIPATKLMRGEERTLSIPRARELVDLYRAYLEPETLEAAIAQILRELSADKACPEHLKNTVTVAKAWPVVQGAPNFSTFLDDLLSYAALAWKHGMSRDEEIYIQLIQALRKFR